MFLSIFLLRILYIVGLRCLVFYCCFSIVCIFLILNSVDMDTSGLKQRNRLIDWYPAFLPQTTCQQLSKIVAFILT